MELFYLLALVLGVLLISGIHAQMDLGKLETWDNFNDVDSEMITMMAPNKLMIRKFEYNGDGPAAWFMIGKEKDDYNEEFANLDGVIIPDEDGGCDRLGRYDGEDIMLTLPKDMKFTDYDYFSVFCIPFSHNFGYIRLRRDAVFNATEQPLVATVADQIAAAAAGPEAEPKTIEECEQDPEPRGENDGNVRRRRKKGNKH
ncbi:Protein Skeletor, isoforms B/C [Orchesella cincta]|uniref:Protein Skeletor, isoforms B/C n=1 Tax=Orchesella cincta TaxID=48709 RepID=A0A1D2NLJ5_ORCCI|nr:Protein Skeletor, isoforms B/C [Orchesella cincta]